MGYNQIMNIFYISTDPQQAANWMVDKHVVKMVTESAQLLSTAHRILDGIEVSGKSKTGRNVKRWVLNDSRDPDRYGKTHKCFEGDLAYMLSSPPNNLKNYEWTKMPSAMADEYKISDDPLTNYRHYYKVGKSHLHAYTNRQPPEWIL